VQYWENITRSFAIAWRHKYLWLLAVFAGEGSASFNYGNRTSSPVPPGRTPGRSPDFGSIQHQASDWLGQHLSLVVTVVVLYVLLVIAFFILAAVCEGALVRASAEHDAERPFGLRLAWRRGVATMGTIIRFRLLLIALGLPVLILFAALIAGLVVAIATNNVGPAVALGLVAFLLILPAIPYAIYLHFLDRLGTRAAVLEQLGAKAAIVRAHRLLRKRLGRVLLVWLLAILVGIVLSIGVVIVLGILFVPALLLGIGAAWTGSAVAWVAVVFFALILVPIALIVSGFVVAQGSTYWTLAFRRMEIDQAPAYGYGYQQAAPPAVTP
jgi:hypothetical protein